MPLAEGLAHLHDAGHDRAKALVVVRRVGEDVPALAPLNEACELPFLSGLCGDFRVAECRTGPAGTACRTRSPARG